MSLSFGLRAFALYIVILGGLVWFTLDNAIERLNDGMRQAAESVMVDTVNIIASLLEQEAIEQSKLDTQQLNLVFELVKNRQISAQIYDVLKTSIDAGLYVTDDQGIIVFDSEQQKLGQDFSQWRDVRLTLEGNYGARTSFLDQSRREPEDPKAMVVAAPITLQEQLIGVVSLVKPINSLEGHLLTESQQLQSYVFGLLAFALLIGYLLSLWFTRSLNRIADYADAMAEGKRVTPPDSRDERLTVLTKSISNLRQQLDGKEYVENYVHSLTHELKTPITGIAGAIELLQSDMPAEDRAVFLKNIASSNSRMARLVDRMLSLAKLEGETQLNIEQFDLATSIERLLTERLQIIESRHLTISSPTANSFDCQGDRVLLSQAIANLVDNAIRFSNYGGTIRIELKKSKNEEHSFYEVLVFNDGETIPEYALPKVYDRFFSLPASQSEDQSKSTGLGLSFVKQIMKLHQGSVEVKNRVNGVVAKLRWPDPQNN